MDNTNALESKAPEPTKPILVLNTQDVGARSFFSLEELEAWVNCEAQGWSWIPKIRKIDGQLQPLTDRYTPLFNAAAELRNATAVATADNARSELLERVRTNLATAFLQFKIVPYQSAPGEFVAKLAERDKRIAGHTLWSLMGNDPVSSSGPAIRGAVLAVSFLEGLTSQSAEAINRSAERWVGEYSEQLSRHRGEGSSLNKAVATTLSEVRTGLAQQIKDFASAQEDRTKSFSTETGERAAIFEKEISDARKQIADIRRTVESDLSLRGAVTYWTRKANSHRNQAWAWGAASLLTGSAIGISAWKLVSAAVSTLVAQASAAGQTAGTPSATPIVAIALLVVIGTLAFWLLRVLVRLTLSNVHLATDGRMRATMMTTYMALLIRGKGELDAKDRQLILSVLFRPSVTGIVKDDATPPGIWDLLTKLLSK